MMFRINISSMIYSETDPEVQAAVLKLQGAWRR
jgi:hypothetical protein